MQGQAAKQPTPARRLVEAAAWRVHLNKRGLQSTGAFEAWLAADPANREAWRRVQAPWDLFGDQAASPELIQARRAALGDARHAARRRWTHDLSGARAGRALAAGLCVAALGGILLWLALKPEVYSTGIGERRIVELSDGSRLSLDAHTEVRVAYGNRTRELRLLRGQARFDVARDVERPFSVQAGGQKVVATGTAFNIDLLDTDLRVTLIEGRVVVLGAKAPARHAVRSAAAEPATANPDRQAPARAAVAQTRPTDDGRGIELEAGEQLVISARDAPSIVPASIERATAWQDGRLVFEHEPLSAVALRMNRYSRRPLLIADEQTAGLRISGVFKTNDIDGFVATISHYFPLRAQARADGAIELRQQ